MVCLLRSVFQGGWIIIGRMGWVAASSLSSIEPEVHGTKRRLSSPSSSDSPPTDTPPSQPRAIFFYVGQGNCTLVESDDAPPILIDCGSSGAFKVTESSNQSTSFSDNSKNQISTLFHMAINKWKTSLKDEQRKKWRQWKESTAIPQNLENDLKEGPEDAVIIITHGDWDHCCWLHDILSKVNKFRLTDNSKNRQGEDEHFSRPHRTRSTPDKHTCVIPTQDEEMKSVSVAGQHPYRFKIYLGGDRSDYMSDTRSSQKNKWLNEIDAYGPIFIGSPDAYTNPWFVPGRLHPHVHVLMALANGHYGQPWTDELYDSNTKSVVLKVMIGKRSLMIGGDATGITTRLILLKDRHGHYKPSPLASHLWLMNHHGAEDDGTNDIAWFDALSPQSVIVSAGFNRKYLHPRRTVLEMVMCLSPDGHSSRTIAGAGRASLACAVPLKNIGWTNHHISHFFELKISHRITTLNSILRDNLLVCNADGSENLCSFDSLTPHVPWKKE